MAFPEKLKALRLKHKLTQEELGEKLCLSRTSISYYEQGKFEPDINTIVCVLFLREPQYNSFSFQDFAF